MLFHFLDEFCISVDMGALLCEECPLYISGGLAQPFAQTTKKAGGIMFDKLSRSFALLRASLAVLRADKELLVFPLCSAIASLLVVASFALPLVASGALERLDAGESPGAGTAVVGMHSCPLGPVYG